MSAMPQSNSRLRIHEQPTHSLQRPTVFTFVSAVTDRHSAVSGFVTFTSQASGATASTSRDVEQHRHAAQRAQDAAGTDAVADGLTDAVPLRDLDVVLHRIEAADRERGDDEVGAVERPAPVAFGLHGHRDAAPAGDLGAEILHELHALGVEIVQHDVRVVQRRRVGEVGEEARRPVIAPAADDRDVRAHARSLRAIAPGQARRCDRATGSADERDLDLDLDRAAGEGRRPRSPNGCAGRRRRTRRPAACSRRRRPRAVARNPARTRRNRGR